MDYRPINTFLDKIKSIVLAGDIQLDVIQSIVSDAIKKPIPKEKIVFKRGILSFNNLSPIYKNEIFINKDKIINNAKGLNINILDIK
jgi:hypothetical protein